MSLLCWHKLAIFTFNSIWVKTLFQITIRLASLQILLSLVKLVSVVGWRANFILIWGLLMKLRVIFYRKLAYNWQRIISFISLPFQPIFAQILFIINKPITLKAFSLMIVTHSCCSGVSFYLRIQSHHSTYVLFFDIAIRWFQTHDGWLIGVLLFYSGFVIWIDWLNAIGSLVLFFELL